MKIQTLALLLTAAMMLPTTVRAEESKTNATELVSPAPTATASPTPTPTVSPDENSNDAKLTLVEVLKRQKNADMTLVGLLEKQERPDAHFGYIQLTLNSNIINVDGKETEMDTEPQVKNERTMLPIRWVAEAAGAEVAYDNETNSAIVTSAAGTEIRCPIGADHILVDGESVDLDSPSYVDESTWRTYLPVRAVSESMNLKVDWVPTTSSVLITAPYQTRRILAWCGDDLPDKTASYMYLPEDVQVVHRKGSKLWVFQFSTEAKAKEAVDVLTEANIPAGLDEILSVADSSKREPGEMNSMEFLTDVSSWGFSNCGFDRYLKEHTDWGERRGIIALLDTRVDNTHPALQGRLLEERDSIGGETEIGSMNRHGTYIADILAEGTKGAPVDLLPLRVVNEKGWAYSSVVAEAMEYAISQKVDVMNLSLTGEFTKNHPLGAVMEEAAENGILIVVPAGNDSREISTENGTAESFPGCITSLGTLVVTAGDKDRKGADFNNYGKSVDLMAPGLKIEAAVPGKENSYTLVTGTGIAAAHVSAAAMLLDLTSEEELTSSQLERAVRDATSGGEIRDGDKYFGCGFLTLVKQGDKPDNPDDSEYTYQRMYWEISDETMSVKFDFPSKEPLWYKFFTAPDAVVQIKVWGVRVTEEGTEITDDLTEKVKLFSNDEEVASFAESGKLTAHKVGQTYVYFEFATNPGMTIPTALTVIVEKK